MTSLLRDVRVLELSTMITGSLTGMLLADFGADVVKVEKPDGGDPFRSFRGGSYSPHFCSYNRNKRSVVLDLKTEDGRKGFLRLVEKADILIENFRPGVLDALNLGDAELAALNTRLIRCHITGFGPDGPYAHKPAYDAVSQAYSGLMQLFINPSDPEVVGPTIADNVTGLYGCYGILSALFERQRTGVGRSISINMLDATVAFIPDPFSYFDQLGQDSDRGLRARTSQSYTFRCSDEKLLSIHLSSQEKFWISFLEALGLEELRHHPDLETRHLRIENYEQLRKMVAGTIAAKPRHHWLAELERRDVPCGPALEIPEVMHDPHVQHLGTFVDLVHAQKGSMQSIRRPVWVDGSRLDQPLRAPPLLGEHDAEVMSAKEIWELAG